MMMPSSSFSFDTHLDWARPDQGYSRSQSRSGFGARQNKLVQVYLFLLIACGCAQFRSRISIWLHVHAKHFVNAKKHLCPFSFWHADSDNSNPPRENTR